jgi:hypothetical protein
MPVEIGGRCVLATETTPNPSLERTSTGKAPGPRGAHCVHHAPRGPGALPVASAQLKR